MKSTADAKNPTLWIVLTFAVVISVTYLATPQARLLYPIQAESRHLS